MKENLEKLINELENLSENNGEKDMIKKISEDQQNCDNEYTNMINNKRITIDNQFIDDNLDKIKKYEKSFHILFENAKNLFENAKNLLENIKKFNGQVTKQCNEPNDSMNDDNNTIRNQQYKQYHQHQQQQQQEMLQKDKIIQAQELQLLTDNQGRALSALECYANRFCKNNKKTNYFDYYNMNNLGNKKDINQLRGQCIVQTQLFRMNYMDYIQKFPESKIDNKKNDKLVEVINNWKNKVDNNDKIIYQEMIDILISSTKTMAFSSKSFNDYSKNCQNARMDPKEIVCIAPGVYNYNHQRSKDAKKNYIETGNMNSNLIIGQSYKDDINGQILMKQIKENKKYYKEQEKIKNQFK